jgi:hypothetical protein
MSTTSSPQNSDKILVFKKVSLSFGSIWAFKNYNALIELKNITTNFTEFLFFFPRNFLTLCRLTKPSVTLEFYSLWAKWSLKIIMKCKRLFRSKL